MIRSLLILWLGPNAFFWSWYYLSLNDISFGTLFFSRRLHDEVFAIYGGFLGLDPAAIPGMVAKALFFDSFIVLGIIALRKRGTILAFAGRTLGRVRQSPAA